MNNKTSIIAIYKMLFLVSFSAEGGNNTEETENSGNIKKMTKKDIWYL